MIEIKDAVEQFQQYLLVERGLSKQTVINYTDDLKRFFELFKDKKYVDDLIGEDLIDFLKYQLSIGRTIPTALRRLSSTKQFFLFCKREGYYRDEIPNIETPKKT